MTENGRRPGQVSPPRRDVFAKKGAASAIGFPDQRSGTVERAMWRLAPDKADVPVGRGEDTAPVSPAGRILVVEDDPLNMKVLTEVLTRRGHTVDAARDGDEALAMAVAHRPDVVLLDLRLPGACGLDIARRIKGNPDLAATKVIALTAYVRDMSRREAAAAGCDGYLSKPVALATLEAAIASATQAVSVDAPAALP